MNVLDRLFLNRVNSAIEAVKREIRIEASEEGFRLGKQAQKELYAATEQCVSKEATHRLKCPNCSKTINIPCVNYVRVKEVYKK